MKIFVAGLKWLFLSVGVLAIILLLSNPIYQIAQGAYSAYNEKVAEQKKIDEQKSWIPAAQIQYPISKDKFKNLDILQIARRIEKEDPISYKFIFEYTKVPMENGGIRKLHPYVRNLYDTCQKTIDSDPLLTEFYTVLVADEILGLNSEMTRISGEVDTYSEAVGRDYIYYIVDNQMKFLMVGLSERGAKILVENLRAPEQKRQKFKLYTPTSSDFAIAKDFTKTMGDFVILSQCLQVDFKLGLLGLGTNFQIRAQQAADMLERKLNIEKAEIRDRRRQDLTDTLNRLNNLN